jgi:hypothetical protein
MKDKPAEPVKAVWTEGDSGRVLACGESCCVSTHAVCFFVMEIWWDLFFIFVHFKKTPVGPLVYNVGARVRTLGAWTLPACECAETPTLCI